MKALSLKQRQQLGISYVQYIPKQKKDVQKEDKTVNTKNEDKKKSNSNSFFYFF